jgi:hypothetical protein
VHPLRFPGCSKGRYQMNVTNDRLSRIVAHLPEQD